jgi:hypothetical protein
MRVIQSSVHLSPSTITPCPLSSALVRFGGTFPSDSECLPPKPILPPHRSTSPNLPIPRVLRKSSTIIPAEPQSHLTSSKLNWLCSYRHLFRLRHRRLLRKKNNGFHASRGPSAIPASTSLPLRFRFLAD